MSGEEYKDEEKKKITPNLTEQQVCLLCERQDFETQRLPKHSHKALLKVVAAPPRGIDRVNSDRGKRSLWFRKSTPDRRCTSQAFNTHAVDWAGMQMHVFSYHSLCLWSCVAHLSGNYLCEINNWFINCYLKQRFQEEHFCLIKNPSHNDISCFCCVPTHHVTWFFC